MFKYNTILLTTFKVKQRTREEIHVMVIISYMCEVLCGGYTFPYIFTIHIHVYTILHTYVLVRIKVYLKAHFL